MLYLLGLAAFAATFLGGLVALRLKDRLHLIVGFSAGAVIGVAFFDLIPEALNLASPVWSASAVTALIALGFAIYLTLDRLVIMHLHPGDEMHAHAARGRAGAVTLALHSFLDGVAIGLAFQVSAAVGFVVAVAVLAHDFSDGINVVSMILTGRGTSGNALRWLALDAVAPLAGVVSTAFFSLPAHALGAGLALFAGFFVYIGASELLPESHHAHPVRWTTIATLLGLLALYIVVRAAGL